MRIQSIRLVNFRSHNDREINFSDKTTIITGKNGVGKTTILEGIYIALQGKSFRGFDNAILMMGEKWYKIECTIDEEFSKRTIVYKDKSKEFTVDDKKYKRLPFKYKYPIVLFEPDISRVLTSSPNRRREFLDNLLIQLDEAYGKNLRAYERVLKQRNTLLKSNNLKMEDLFAWNISLSRYGAHIIKSRVGLIEKLNKNINRVYKSIAQIDDQIELNYSFDTQGNIEQKLLLELEKNFIKDKTLGSTTVGPHRHDLIVNFNNSLLSEVASRGEIRTLVLALKFIEVELIEEILGLQPIILLDDVFGELDESRQLELIKFFNNYQKIIASIIPISNHDELIEIKL